MQTTSRFLTVAGVMVVIGFLVGACSGRAVGTPQYTPVPANLQVATFAGGCFWCMEPPFDHLEGVISTTSGYMGGQKVNPTYEEVSGGNTGHAEVVQVVYDPARVRYETLLEVYWQNVDPFDKEGQFCDKGNQYRSEIFVHDSQQQKLAEASKQQLPLDPGQKAEVVTPIATASTFYPAEDYHQDYYLKNPNRYKFYRYACGRDQRLQTVWGKK